MNKENIWIDKKCGAEVKENWDFVDKNGKCNLNQIKDWNACACHATEEQIKAARELNNHEQLK